MEDQDFLTSSSQLPVPWGHLSALSCVVVTARRGPAGLCPSPHCIHCSWAVLGVGKPFGWVAAGPGSPSAWLNSPPFPFPWLEKTSCPLLWVLCTPSHTHTHPKPHSSIHSADFLHCS